MEEIDRHDDFKDAVLSLAQDERFLAIVAYFDFIYKELLENYEFNNSRDALKAVGHKVCLRELISEIKINMTETTHNEEIQW